MKIYSLISREISPDFDFLQNSTQRATRELVIPGWVVRLEETSIGVKGFLLCPSLRPKQEQSSLLIPLQIWISFSIGQSKR